MVSSFGAVFSAYGSTFAYAFATGQNMNFSTITVGDVVVAPSFVVVSLFQT